MLQRIRWHLFGLQLESVSDECRSEKLNGSVTTRVIGFRDKAFFSDE